jgi:mono/diheme cytochrome c family protein
MNLTRILIAAAVAAATLAPAVGHAQLNAVGEGRRAWLRLNCYGCHGNNGAGGMGPNIQHAEFGDVREAMFGDAMEGGMRSFTGFAKSNDPANIAAYLATIGTAKEPTWLDWWNAKP